MYFEKYDEYLVAKQNKDIETLQKLSKEYPEVTKIKFSIAKILIDSSDGNEYQKKVGKALLIDLLDTPSRNFALLELAKYEYISSRYEHSSKYYNTLLDEAITQKDINCVLLGLGKIAYENENYDLARNYLNKLLKNSETDYDRCCALMELGRVEKKVRNYDKANYYFNLLHKIENSEFSKLEQLRIKLEQGKTDETKKELISLLKSSLKFKKINYILLELGKVEVIKNNIDSAFNIFNYIYYNGDFNDKRYCSLEKAKAEYLFGKKENLVKTILNLYNLYTEKSNALYFECIMYLKDKNYDKLISTINKGIKENIVIDYKILLQLYKNCNIIILKDYSNSESNYLINQIIDYDEFIAIEYIIERNKKLFNSNIDVYSLFNAVKRDLNDENRINKLQYCDEYIVQYNKIGNNDESILKILTLPDTKNIVSMYPSFEQNYIEDEEIKFNKKIK